MWCRWIYDFEVGLLFSCEIKDVIKGSMINKGYLVVMVYEGKFKVIFIYQKVCYVYIYGVYDEILYEVYYVNLNKQDNCIKNICLMLKEKYCWIYKNVCKFIWLGYI